jgi:hypothetical protein
LPVRFDTLRHESPGLWEKALYSNPPQKIVSER